MQSSCSDCLRDSLKSKNVYLQYNLLSVLNPILASDVNEISCCFTKRERDVLSCYSFSWNISSDKKLGTRLMYEKGRCTGLQMRPFYLTFLSVKIFVQWSQTDLDIFPSELGDIWSNNVESSSIVSVYINNISFIALTTIYCWNCYLSKMMIKWWFFPESWYRIIWEITKWFSG